MRSAGLRDEPSDIDEECRSLVKKLGEAGWLQYCVSDEGGVLDVRSLALIRETLARHSGLADFAFAMQGLGSGTISLFGSEEQKAAYLPAVARGEKIAAFALTEPSSGSDVASIETSADEQGREFVINGTKTFMSNGGIADFYIVFARTGEAPGAKGISAFVVDRSTPGLSDDRRIEVIAPHPMAELRFENARLPKTALVGVQGKGFAQAMATLDVFRTTVGAAALGFAKRALQEATRRTQERMLGGTKLSDDAITQSKLAEMIVDIEASALLVYRAAWLRDVKGRSNKPRSGSRETLCDRGCTDGHRQGSAALWRARCNRWPSRGKPLPGDPRAPDLRRRFRGAEDHHRPSAPQGMRVMGAFSKGYTVRFAHCHPAGIADYPRLLELCDAATPRTRAC